MAREVSSIDLNHNAPSLQSAAREVAETKRRLVIRQDGKPVAFIVPANRVVKRRVRRAMTVADGVQKYPTVASLAGAAGTLPHPLSWDEMREIAWEDHIAEKYRK